MTSMVSPPEEQAGFANAATRMNPDTEVILSEYAERYIALLASLHSEKLGSSVRKNIHHAGLEPYTFGDMCRSEYREIWEKAMEKELKVRVSNGMFTVADVSAG